MTTTEQALATVDNSPGALVRKYRADFAEVLPTHIKPATWVRLAQGVLKKNPDLADAAQRNPGSFLAALLDCARLGHEPGTDSYALTHFMNRKTGVPEIVGIEQYQGEIERMYRAGAVLSVKCEVVRANDVFRWSPTTMRLPIHEFDALADTEDRGALRGVYAFAEMQGGALSQPVVMSKSEVMLHKAVAKTTKFWEGPWEPSMWKKTAIHELQKWVPTSSEYMKERIRAAAAVEESPSLSVLPPPITDSPSPAAEFDPDTGEVYEGELLPPEGAA